MNQQLQQQMQQQQLQQQLQQLQLQQQLQQQVEGDDQPQQHSMPSSSLMPYSMYPQGSLLSYGPAPLHGFTSPVLAKALSTLNADKSRRSRGEKRPIPEEQKDDKYFERRKRNNEAAKKSRDARKSREDDLALRATYLRREQAYLIPKAQALREENAVLKHLLLLKCQEDAVESHMQGIQQQGQMNLQNPAPNSSQDSAQNSI